ncbi:DNA topoisomerase IB [Luteolibacter marinus]|uniref:DNA topoisomerase IB n=1 Tax=Luteolibacter marinus TaxID=2776705 RepID=UPI0018663197|nr:DNA topoisomerase IB [Luteolibacter marinus]
MKLIRTCDTEPGFRRRRHGRGFAYFDPDGGRLGAGEHLDRIRSLAIPPAYDRVWICIPPNGHLQATGHDARSRKQYRYHPEWQAHRNRVKFDGLLEFARALPSIRDGLDSILARRALDEETATSLAIAIIDRTGARVGNESYREANGTYGITTLAKRHAELHGRTIELSYKAKHGKQVRLRIDAPALARHLGRCHELPGQHLFAYPDDAGEVHPVDSGMVNGMIQRLSRGDFSAKTFRTWRGSLIAFGHLVGLPDPETQTGRKAHEVDAVRHTAKALGNTPATSRNYYVHPIITSAWMDGRFEELVAGARKRRCHSRLRSPVERLFARFLEVTSGQG